ncbi:hypothetical protein LDENG_00169180 [Lucifuga dentata]|nr:hypothetical protein LDENG_00169180 [Lucifuga dentata]
MHFGTLYNDSVKGESTTKRTGTECGRRNPVIFPPSGVKVELRAHSVICANGPEELSPVGRQEEAEDFRATDSVILAMRFDASIH